MATATYTNVKKIQIGNNIYELGVPDHDHSQYVTSSEIPDDTNQKIKVDTVTFGADAEVELVGGDNVTVTGDSTNNTITISATQDGNDNQTTWWDGVSFEANATVKIIEGSNISITASATQNTATIAVTGLATVATSGSYEDLDKTPSINDATLTIQRNGVTVDTFSANSATDATINIEVPAPANAGTLTIVSNNNTVATFSANSATNVIAAIDVPVVYDWATAATKPSYNLGEIEDTESYVRMTSAERKQLEGIDKDDLVNQNAFANIVVGSATITADSEQDTVTFVAGNNVTLTADTSQNTITIAASDSKVTATTNHYIPFSATASALTAAATSTTAASWGSTKLVTGVTLQRDERGHVTGLSVDSVTMPSNPDTNLVTSVNGQTGSVTIPVPAAANDARITIAASTSGATSTTFGDFTTDQSTDETIFIPVASTTNAGLMSASDKVKLNELDFDDVVLGAPLKLTKTFGKYTKPSDKYWYEVGTATMTLRELFMDAFSDENANQPDAEMEDLTVFSSTPTNVPTITLNSTTKSGEVGESVTFNLNPTFGSTTPGSFKYGSLGADGKPDTSDEGKQTGLTFEYSATVSNTSGITTATLDTTSAVLTDTQATIEVTATHKRSALTKHPVGSKGSDLWDSATVEPYRTATTTTKTATLTLRGYRCMFYGVTESDADTFKNSLGSTASTNREILIGDNQKNQKVEARTTATDIFIKPEHTDVLIEPDSADKALYCALPETLTYSSVVAEEWSVMFGKWASTATENLSYKDGVPVTGAGSATSKQYRVYTYTPTGEFVPGAQYRFVIS